MINLKGLQVKLRNFALQNINLNIETGDYFMLVGPTGAGKTLLLETIAGLQPLTQGEIWIDERNITKLEPEKRGISIVYQDHALFPHLSVAENIIFGLKARRKAAKDIRREFSEMVELVKVSHLLDRKPEKLSGGEKQKVALARSLIVKPLLLLLDEPLSAIDPQTREDLQVELKRIHENTGVTIIHVTHDFQETLLLGKHAAVIGDGNIKQIGTPTEILRHPNSEFVAHFTVMRNVFPGKIINSTGDKSIFRSGSIELTTTTDTTTVSYACVRPDDITISTNSSSSYGINKFPGTIIQIEDGGTSILSFVNIGVEICCLVTHHDFLALGLEEGKRVSVSFEPEAVHVF